MRTVQKHPLGERNGYKLYSVSAFEVRQLEEEDEEFGLYAHGLDFPNLIPRDEIWLAEEGEAEWPIFIEGALAWLKTGNYDDALLTERRARGGIQIGHTLTPDLYRQFYRTLDGMDVWFVDGKLVRDRYKTDFVEGGNPAVYPWIPRNEIWLSDAVEEEWPYLLIHEYTEYRLMMDKAMSYPDAHDLANDAERKARAKR